MTTRESALTDGKLKSEKIDPIIYRLGFEDSTQATGVRFLQLSCHMLYARDGFVQLWRVVNGRLQISCSYTGVVSVEEV